MTFEEMKTTFWSDFTIADAFGPSAVKDTYRRAQEWKIDPSYWGELVCVLNWKCWMWNDRGNETMMALYRDLYEKANAWGLNHYKGSDFKTYFDIVD